MNEQPPTEEPINNINRLVTTRMDETIKRLNVLSSITRTAMSSCDMAITVMVLLEQLCEQFGADAAAFWVYQHASNSLELLSWRGIGPKPKPAPISDLCSGYPGKVLRTADPGNLSPDLDPSAFCRPEMIAGRSFHAYLAIPLIFDAKITGVVEIYNRDPQAQEADARSNLIDICQQCALPLNLIHTVTEANRNNQFLLTALEEMLSSYANTLDMHEHKQTGHSTGLAHTASHLARAMGLSEEKVAIIKRGALLHDLGNIIISDEIFLKPGPLTDEEWAIIQQHTRTGYDFLKEVEFLKPSLEILYSHHERWDGKGYPEGLHGDQIPFYARIFSVADTWECLMADRPYRPAFSRDETLDFIRQQSGLAFDPAIVEVFLEHIPTVDGTPPRHRPSLLIVDDESNITKALARSLRLDFDVVTANSAEEALHLLKKKDFKIILTDQRMPGMTGIELLRQARKLRPTSVGLLLSAYLDSAVLADAINLGNVFGFVGKPWDQSDLHNRLISASEIVL